MDNLYHSIAEAYSKNTVLPNVTYLAKIIQTAGVGSAFQNTVETINGGLGLITDSQNSAFSSSTFAVLP